jgi:AcrR family transcriptional regulator
MVLIPTFEPAPGRGQYDRRQPREIRLLEQRERLMSATALALARSGATTITAVVTLARVSRNTFYEYFDDLEHARGAAMQRSKARLEHALREAEQSARTPVERWRALARAWFEWVVADPAEARLILEVGAAALSSAGVLLEAALKRSLSDLRTLGVKSGEGEGPRIVAATATGEAFARELAANSLAAEASPPASERQRIERALLDVIVRVLR